MVSCVGKLNEGVTNLYLRCKFGKIDTCFMSLGMESQKFGLLGRKHHVVFVAVINSEGE